LRIDTNSPATQSHQPRHHRHPDGAPGAQQRARRADAADIATSGSGRVGTPEDIARAAEFLLDPQSSFITGTDLLVDGGVVAAVTTLTPVVQ